MLWEPDTVPGSVALPGRLVGAASDALFGFFGRGAELAALHEARKQAHSTRRCELALVAGEAGMGKTALAAQVARTAHVEGAVVLFGHADEDLGVRLSAVDGGVAEPQPRRRFRTGKRTSPGPARCPRPSGS